LSVRLHIASGH